ncbi:MAG TPA: hypothetical protein DCG32_09630 [Sphaerochaeta sp.]|jgi:hypothetical protein|nr:hypothetical protein [Sphaerochaeta sp.]
MNMRNKKFLIAMVLIVVAVASVSAASYGNRWASDASDTRYLGQGRAITDSQVCLVTGEEVVAGTRLGYADRGFGMYGAGVDDDGLCLVTGEAPVPGSRQGGGLRSNASQGGGMRWSR